MFNYRSKTRPDQPIAKSDIAVLKSIFAKAALQGDQDKKIQTIFNLLIEACEAEYTEDNKPTLTSYLYGQFKQSLLSWYSNAIRILE